MLIAAILLLWPSIRWLKIRGWQDFGIRRNNNKFRHVLAGFAFAFVLLMVMGFIAVQLDIYHLQKNIRWDKMLKIPATMIVVALLEEFLFRGAMLGLLMRRTRSFSALLFVSFLYSIVHFLKPMENVDTGAITWASGFQLLPYSFHQFTQPMLLLGGFCTLFAIGYVLGQTRLRTRSLWMPCGLHAGWIAGNRVFNITFKRHDELMPWFGPRIEIGIAPLITVILTGLLIMWWLRHNASSRRS